MSPTGYIVQPIERPGFLEPHIPPGLSVLEPCFVPGDLTALAERSETWLRLEPEYHSAAVWTCAGAGCAADISSAVEIARRVSDQMSV